MSTKIAHDLPLSDVRDSLEPYIKSRADVLRIRKHIAAYLQSNVGELGCLNHERNGKAIEPDASHGVRIYGRLFDAVRSNSKAKEEALRLQQHWRDDHFEKEPLEKDVSSTETASQRLDYLKKKVDIQKIQILSRHVTMLKSRPAAQSEYLEDLNKTGLDTLPDLSNTLTGRLSASQGSTNVEDIERALKKAIIAATTSRDHEDRLLTRAEQSSTVKSCHGADGLGSIKFARARQALIDWIEDELGDEKELNGSDDYQLDRSESETKESTALDEVYVRYLQSRRALVRAIAIPNSVDLKSPPTLSDADVRDETFTPEEKPYGTNDLHLIQYLEKSLLPTFSAQKLLAVRITDLVKASKQADDDCRRSLELLAEESHLLPKYPLLIDQPRFKHAAAVFGSRNSRGDHASENQCLRQARAWAFAARSASDADSGQVDALLEKGRQSVSKSTTILVYLDKNLNPSRVAAQEHEAPEQPGDVWMTSTHEKQGLRDLRRRRRGADTSARTQDPWDSLNGHVGVLQQTDRLA